MADDNVRKFPKHREGTGVPMRQIQMQLDIVAVNKGEEPFVTQEVFEGALQIAMHSLIDDQPVPYEDLVKLIASHHWYSRAQRSEFKKLVFMKFFGSEAQDEVDDMPLNHEDTVQATPSDVLSTMIDMQRRHMTEYQDKYLQNGAPICVEYEWGHINYRNTQRAIRETNGWLIEELMEAQNLLKIKPWKMNPASTDPEQYYREIGDAIHFFLELLILSGLDTADKVWAVYNERSDNNIARREGNY